VTHCCPNSQGSSGTSLKRVLGTCHWRQLLKRKLTCQYWSSSLWPNHWGRQCCVMVLKSGSGARLWVWILYHHSFVRLVYRSGILLCASMSPSLKWE
jgi:hypothetical protein